MLSLGVILGLSNAGYDVAMLIAGLGLGGLAIAIAVQAWLGNVIGGANVFMDRHFSVGDRIQIEGSSGRIDGEVLEIGLRTTRIKTRLRRRTSTPRTWSSRG